MSTTAVVPRSGGPPSAGPLLESFGPAQTSATLGKLAAALARVQGQLGHVAKDKTVKTEKYKYTYADLASCIDAVRAPLAANEIAVVQVPSADGVKVTVTTMIMHSSGEWVSGELTLSAAKADPQSIGSAISYGRRYGLSAMLGLATEDDDGQVASQPAPARQAQQQAPRQAAPSTRTQPAAELTPEYKEELRGYFDCLDNETQRAFRGTFKVKEPEQVSVMDYPEVRRRLRSKLGLASKQHLDGLRLAQQTLGLDDAEFLKFVAGVLDAPRTILSLTGDEVARVNIALGAESEARKEEAQAQAAS